MSLNRINQLYDFEIQTKMSCLGNQKQECFLTDKKKHIGIFVDNLLNIVPAKMSGSFGGED